MKKSLTFITRLGVFQTIPPKIHIAYSVTTPIYSSCCWKTRYSGVHEIDFQIALQTNLNHNRTLIE